MHICCQLQNQQQRCVWYHLPQTHEQYSKKAAQTHVCLVNTSTCVVKGTHMCAKAGGRARTGHTLPPRLSVPMQARHSAACATCNNTPIDHHHIVTGRCHQGQVLLCWDEQHLMRSNRAQHWVDAGLWGCILANKHTVSYDGGVHPDLSGISIFLDDARVAAAACTAVRAATTGDNTPGTNSGSCKGCPAAPTTQQWLSQPTSKTTEVVLLLIGRRLCNDALPCDGQQKALLAQNNTCSRPMTKTSHNKPVFDNTNSNHTRNKVASGLRLARARSTRQTCMAMRKHHITAQHNHTAAAAAAVYTSSDTKTNNCPCQRLWPHRQTQRRLSHMRGQQPKTRGMAGCASLVVCLCACRCACAHICAS